MTHHVKAVREAANKLFDAVKAAEADGYRVSFPVRASELPNIGVSETARVKSAPMPKPPTIANPDPAKKAKS